MNFNKLDKFAVQKAVFYKFKKHIIFAISFSRDVDRTGFEVKCHQQKDIAAILQPIGFVIKKGF